MTHGEMVAATAGLQTKSGKIRALDGAGASRAQIAAFIGISYQHVHNVLQRDRKKSEPVPASPLSPSEYVGRFTVDTEGVLLPPKIAERLGLRAGDDLFLFAEGDGFRLLSRHAALERLKPLLRSRLPAAAAEIIEALVGKE